MNNCPIKKLIALFLALSMLFSLAACESKPAQQNDKIESLTPKEESLQPSKPEGEAEDTEAEPVEETDGEKTAEEKSDEAESDAEEPEVEYKKFSDMEYVRPDTEVFRAATEHAVELLNSDASYEEICEALDAYEIQCGHFNTMYVIAEIRSYQDMTDTFYAEELAWVEENQAQFAKLEDHMFYAAAASPYIDKLEEDYFWEGFAGEYADEADSVYTDTYMALDKQESEILTEYREMVAAPTILYRGEERDFNELIETLSGMEYLQALEKYYDKYNSKLADIYIRLIKVRNQIAAEQGYESYEDYAYNESFERDYTPEEAEILIQAVRQYAIPAYEKINSRYSYSDVDYFELSESSLVSVMDNFTGNMGGDIREAFEFMCEYELYDVSVSSKKADMSFETYIEDYESPFILSDCYGDSDDIMTFAHEFGHFSRDYVNYGAQAGIDVQEIFSQSMEYLSLFYLDNEGVTEEQLYSLLLMEILGIYSSYAQAGYAEFEHRVYSMNPDSLTAEKINDIWLEICQDYGISIEGYEYLYRMMWIDVPHFFEYPFYVISYTVSNEAAIQLFQLEAENSGSGLEMYNTLLLSESSEFLALIEECGLESPFSVERVKKSADFLLNICENVL